MGLLAPVTDDPIMAILEREKEHIQEVEENRREAEARMLREEAEENSETEEAQENSEAESDSDDTGPVTGEARNGSSSIAKPSFLEDNLQVNKDELRSEHGSCLPSA